jgi:hypothetical protein
MKSVISKLTNVAVLLLICEVAMAQGGASPYLNSTHTYTVTMEDGLNNTDLWVIANDAGIPLAIQPTFSADVDGNIATLVITWADSWASVGSAFKILFSEEDDNTLCVSQRELDVNVIANTFYLTMEADASDCHNLSGEILGEDVSGNTTLLFTVNLNKDASWDIDNWVFDFTVGVTGNYILQSVKVNDGSDLGDGGTYSAISVSGVIIAAQIEVVVNGPVEEGSDVTVEIVNGKALKSTITTPDNGTGDKDQILTVNPLPATSIISFD